MAKDLRFYLTVWLKDRATKELDGVRKSILRVGDAVKAVRAGPGAALRFGGPVAGFLLGGLSVAIKVVQSLVGIVAGVVGSVVGLVVGAIRTIIRAIEGVSGFIIGTLVKIGKVAGVAVGAATAAFILFTRQVVVAGDALADMSKRTGLSVKFLSEMKSVLEKSDASLESVRVAIRSLGRAVEGAVRGEKEYVDLWRQLGVSLTDQNGKLRTSEDLFVALVDALRRIPNELVRVGMAQRIFGRSADELMVLINNTTESLADQRAEAQRLGATWSNKLAAAADRVADAWVDLGTAWAALKREFLGPFLRPIAEAFEALATWTASNREQVARWGETAAAWAEHVAKVLIEKVGGAWDWISTRAFSWDALKAGAAGALQLIRDQAGNVLDWIVARLTVLKTHALDAVDEVLVYLSTRFDAQLSQMATALRRLGLKTMKDAMAEPKIGERIPWWARGILSSAWLLGRKAPMPGAAAKGLVGEAIAGAGDAVAAAREEIGRRAAEAPGAALAREAERAAAEATAARIAAAIADAFAAKGPEIIGAAFPTRAGGGAGKPTTLGDAILMAVQGAASATELSAAIVQRFEAELKAQARRIDEAEQKLKRLGTAKR